MAYHDNDMSGLFKKLKKVAKKAVKAPFKIAKSVAVKPVKWAKKPVKKVARAGIKYGVKAPFKLAKKVYVDAPVKVLKPMITPSQSYADEPEKMIIRTEPALAPEFAYSDYSPDVVQEEYSPDVVQEEYSDAREDLPGDEIENGIEDENYFFYEENAMSDDYAAMDGLFSGLKDKLKKVVKKAGVAVATVYGGPKAGAALKNLLDKNTNREVQQAVVSQAGNEAVKAGFTREAGENEARRVLGLKPGTLALVGVGLVGLLGTAYILTKKRR